MRIISQILRSPRVLAAVRVHSSQRFVLTLTGLLAFLPAFVLGSEFYVSPSADAGGNGSIDSPWTLTKALSQPSAVHAGDTIWLRGGTYTGIYTSTLTGTASSPIIVRQYPGERATIDGGDSSGEPILFVGGAYTWYWGFEVMSSDLNRVSAQASSQPTDIGRGEGIVIQQVTGGAVGTKFINLVVHDTRQGFSYWKEATDSEIYGCLIYYNGWQGPDSGHGHGIYVQNETGTKRMVDNILFQQFSHGIHGYGSSTYLNNLYAEGNSLIENGIIATSGPGRNFLIGGEPIANNPSVISNFFYYLHSDQPRTAFKLGYQSGCTNATVTGNYVANNLDFSSCTPATMTGNTIYGIVTGIDQSQFPDNTFLSQPPSSNAVFIRPNAYELGRANITVFNWAHQDSVDVDLTGAAYLGNQFQILDAQNYFGAPVVSGVYNGGTVSIPMGLTPSAPVGWSTPSPTGPEFNAFILISLPGPYDFFDVSPSNPYRDSIVKVASNGITAGCGGGNFCPQAPVLRDQMAVFLLKGEHGSGFAPPSATGNVFTDVPATAFAADWIEQAAAEAIASGCGNGQYCPRSPVTRAQMAVLLLKATLGADYAPPPATGTVFGDVPADAFAAAWIEDLANRGLTAGCGSGLFCPGSTVTRGQMAAFLSRAFALP